MPPRSILESVRRRGPDSGGVQWRSARESITAMPMLSIRVISDVICPWCFIGKRRLERALGMLPDGIETEICWTPFQLNPGMPPEGIARKQYRTAKFGSWERSRQLDLQVALAGSGEGIEFAFARMERTPNTFQAHRLIRLARLEGVEHAVVEGLFQRYFIEAENVGDPEVLTSVANAAGIEAARARRFLDSEDGAAEVRAEEEEARRLGVSGVPFFVVGDRYRIEGAQPAEVLVETLLRASQNFP